MTARLSGTLTFFFTDIEGSTRLWEDQPEAMALDLALHDTLLREAVERHDGQVFKTMGDAFDAVFPSAASAVAAAVEAQRALAAERWRVPGGLRVRMALGSGEAEVRGDDFFGPTLNRTSRLLQVAHGGQILLFGATASLVRDTLAAGLTLRDLGEHRLRDLARPERIYQVVGSGMPGDFPPLRSLEAGLHNLPVQLTTFVGRERELEQVKSRLREVRLVTLTGAGGAGKTRLALQAGADLMERFPDGVWLVELAPLTDPSLVLQTVAAAVGLREQGEIPIPLLEKVVDLFRPKHLLLVLDNCEHLRAACTEVAGTLLTRCPEVRILATSQEPLGVAGEATLPVPPLALPDPQRLDPGQLARSDAVRLFVDRTLLSKPGFAITDANAASVASVVQQLEGIPLAIELAAARTRMMTVEEIARRLGDRFRLLTGTGRGLPTRHQTLQAAMDWSYDLLTEQEAALLRRLSIFAGGWNLDAAEAICADTAAGIGEVLDLLTRLVDRSLVLVLEPDGGDTRYRLLETVRQYVRNRLDRMGETSAVASRHAAWYLSVAEESAQHLRGRDASGWFDRLETEHDNMRAALQWFRGTGEVENEQRLAGALWRFWEMRGYWTEGRSWLEGALHRSSTETAGRGRALIGAASLAFFQGDFAEAVALAEESLALSRKLGDKRGAATCLNILGLEACRLERYDHAAQLSEESLALSREAGDTTEVSDAFIVQSFVARAKGDYQRAADRLEQVAAQAREIGDKWRLSLALNNLGLIKREQGDYARAKALLEETLGLAREVKDKWGAAFALSNLGIVAWYEGDFLRAERFFGESVTPRMELGDRRGLATSFIGLAAAAVGRGQRERAAVLFGAAEGLRENIQVALPPFIRSKYDGLVAEVREALGEGNLAQAWERGKRLTLDQAAALALATDQNVS